MKIRIGAIGASDSLKQIQAVAQEDPRIELVVFEYQELEELDAILQENRYRVSQWIFSGPSPFHYCLDKELISSNEGMYPPVHGMALLGTYLNVTRDYGRMVKKISLDKMDEKTVREMFNEYNLEDVQFRLCPEFGFSQNGKLIEFHTKCYESGLSEVALTCHLGVHLELQKRGIPSYRIIPPKLAIRTVFRLLVGRAKNEVYGKLKMAIAGIEVIWGKEDKEKRIHSFSEQEKLLELKLELLGIAKQVNGSLVDKGESSFLIYATQGDYELLDSSGISFVARVDEILRRLSLEYRFVIGIGFTVYDAEQHVQLGFEYATDNPARRVVVVDEEKTISDFDSGYLPNFSEEHLPEHWKTTLLEHQYKPVIPAKLYHYMKLKDLEEITSETLTIILKNTERNSRRILNELEQLKLIEVTREESLGRPGRPRKVYRLVE